MFSTKPQGKFIINVCKSPVCFLKGSDNIIEMLKDKLGVEMGETTADGVFTLRQVECLGQCDVAPMMAINQKIYGDLNDVKLDAILTGCRTSLAK
jgi:NADH-quinone oxidoreductase subunit E